MARWAYTSMDGSRPNLRELLQSPRLSFDVEGTGTDLGSDIPLGLSLACNPSSGYYAPIEDSFAKNLLAMNKLYIAHNASYDRSMAKKAGVIVDRLADTMIAAHLLEKSPLSLRSLSKFDIRSFGELKGGFAGMSIEDMGAYSCPHAIAAYDLWIGYEKRLKELALDKLFWSILMPLVPVISDMELNGVVVDKEALNKTGELIEDMLGTLREALDYWSGTSGVNYNSPDQLSGVLYSKLGLPKHRWIKTRKGRPTTDAKYLQTIKDKHPFVPTYLQYKQLMTLRNSYVRSLSKIIHADGRVYCKFNQTGTRTGRLSCVAGDTMVATPQGYRPIKGIKKGDYVQTLTGPAKVLNVRRASKETLYELRFSDGGKILATPEHHFFIGDSREFKGGKFRSVRELCKNDIVWLAIYNAQGLTNSQLPQEFTQLFPKLNTKVAEFLGFVTAEGCYASPLKISLTTNSADEADVRRYFSTWLKSRGLRVAPVARSDGSAVQVIYSGPLVKALRSIGLGSKSPLRVVPPTLFGAPMEIKAGFLRGLFTGVGINPLKDIALVTSSEVLAQGVRLLLNSIGIGCTVDLYDTWYVYKGVKKHGNKWHVRIPCLFYSRFSELVGYIGRKEHGMNQKLSATDYSRGHLSLGAGRLSNITLEEVKRAGFRRMPVRLVSKEQLGTHDVYDLEVEDTHHYFANGYITHNSSQPNLQKIPVRTELGRRIREAFVAPKGYKLLAPDYDQLEFKVLAICSKNPYLLDAFKNDRDIHLETALRTYGSEKRRREAKTTNFKIIYGGGSIIDRQPFFYAYPGIEQWMKGVHKQAREAQYIRTLNGRIRTIESYTRENKMAVMGDLEEAHGDRETLSTLIQGTSAEEVQVGMIELWKSMRDSEIKMNLQVHDELLLEVPEDIVMDVAKIIKEKMTIRKYEIPLTVSIKVGDNWGNMTKLEIN